MRWKPKGVPPVLFLLLAGASACRAPASGPPLPAVEFEVEFAGCAATLVPGPICVLKPERGLTLWVTRPPDTEIEILAGGRDVAKGGESVGEGTRYGVVVPPGAERVEVRARSAGSEQTLKTLLLSGPRRPGAEERDVQGEINLGTQGTRNRTGNGTFDRIQRLELNEARASLEKLGDLAPIASLPAESRYLLTYNRCLLRDKEGDYRSALEEIGHAIEISRRGNLTEFGWQARQKHALLLSDLGRLREAAEAYRALAKDRSADRTDCAQALLLNNWAWATLLARESSRSVEAEGLEEPVPLLEEAASLWNPSRCDLEQAHLIQLNLLLAHLQGHRPNLAAQALAAARRVNKDATLLLHLWELDLAARLDLAQSQPRQAIDKYQQLETLAEGAHSPDGQLRAALGQAQGLAALGDRAGALASLGKANQLLDGQSLQVPLHGGRATFVSQREAVAGLEIDLLLAAGRTPEAFVSARRAQSRVLRQLAVGERLAGLSAEERKSWGQAIGSYQQARTEVDEAAQEEWRLLDPEIPLARSAREKKASEAARDLDRAFSLLHAPPAQAAFAPIRPGELILLVQPVLAGTWVAFAAESDGRISYRLFPVSAKLLASPAGIARQILEPFGEQIRRARRIRVLRSGALGDIDFHALPFGRDILLTAKPVIYGLDLSPSARAATRPRPGASLQALIVADPTGDLPGSRKDAEAVSRSIEAWQRSEGVTRLTGSQAEMEAVRRKLAEVEIFHFSGHGRFGGLGGLDSSLLLDAKQRLTVGDVLVLGRVPRWVFLSGCETARSEGTERSDGIGIAQAFALAGSEAVVASVRSVNDQTAADFLSDLYRRWDGTSDPASALQQAQLAWRQRDPRADWASFRITEP